MTWTRNWEWFDPRTPGEREEFEAWRLAEESGFRPAIVERARTRLRRFAPRPDPGAPGTWILIGDEKLGDAHGEYRVSLRDGQYACTCWAHMGGERRSREVCSHVLAVVLARRLAAEREDTPDPGRLTVPDPPSRITPAPLDWSHPADLGLPDKFREFRGVQILALKAIERSRAKVFALQAPTGSGKALIGAAAGRLLGAPVLYLATTKQLQDQLAADFPEAVRLKGRENYVPLNYLPPEPGCEEPEAHRVPRGVAPTTAECDKEGGRCTYCHDVRLCPYERDKAKALRAPMAVLNTAYYLSEVNHVGRFSDASEDGGTAPRHPLGERLVVIDEADTLEGQLMAFVEVSVSKRLRASLGLNPPRHKDPRDKEGEWGPWIVEEALPALAKRIRELEEETAALRGLVQEADDEGLDDDELLALSVDEGALRVAAARERYRQGRRELNGLRRVEGRLVRMAEDLRENASSWVRTDEADRDGTIRFKPVTVSRHAREFLWRHAGRFLVMSATLLSPQSFAGDLGLRPDEVEFVDLPSTFPPERRPIRVRARGDMRRRSQADALGPVVEEIDSILDEHPERVLIHSVSYRLSAGIAERSRHIDRIHTFTPERREAALAAFKAIPGAVLLGPALERGVDLPDELCRVIVVPKIPYPSLGDRQVARRFYGFGSAGRLWYMAQTVRALCQATGRGMRHEADWCETYILDSAFRDLYKQNRRLFPPWWREAIVFEGPAVSARGTG